jgi:hypothetical protein
MNHWNCKALVDSAEGEFKNYMIISFQNFDKYGTILYNSVQNAYRKSMHFIALYNFHVLLPLYPTSCLQVFKMEEESRIFFTQDITCATA